MNFLRKIEKPTINISLLYIFFLIPVLVLYFAIAYGNNESLLDRQFRSDLKLLKSQQLEKLSNFFDPMIAIAQATANFAALDVTFARHSKIRPYLLRELLSNENIQSVFMGFTDGGVTQIVRGEDLMRLSGAMLKKNIRFKFEIIDRSKSQAPTENYTFLNESNDNLESGTGDAKYDPRLQKYYNETMARPYRDNPGEFYISDPEPSSISDLKQLTITSAITANKEFYGVAGVSATLQKLVFYLSRNRSSQNAQTYIVNNAMEVITTTDSEMKNGISNVYAGRSISTIGNAVLKEAIREYTNSNEEILTIKTNGNDIRQNFGVLITDIPEKYHKDWRLIVVVPESDLDNFGIKTNKQFIWIFLGILLCCSAGAVIVSSAISRSLKKITFQLDHMATLQNTIEHNEHSYVSEIRHLNSATENLRLVLDGVLPYIPRDLIGNMLTVGWALNPRLERRESVVMITNVTSDHGWAQWATPDESIQMISDYLHVVHSTVKDESGIMERFYGTSTLAVWGLPFAHESDALHACIAAVRAKKRLINLNKSFPKQRFLPFSVCLHKDNFLIGNIGSNEQLSFATIGDEVKTLKCLENINAEYMTLISMSESLYDRVTDQVLARPINKVLIRNKLEMVYELLAIVDGDNEVVMTFDLQEKSRMTSYAFSLFEKGDYLNAAHAYTQISVRFNDALSKKMVELCQQELDRLFPGEFMLTEELLLPEQYRSHQSNLEY